MAGQTHFVVPSQTNAPSMAAHLCCYHPTNSHYTTNPPQQIEACCHCGNQRGMGFTRSAQVSIPPGHGPYYPRSF